MIQQLCNFPIIMKIPPFNTDYTSLIQRTSSLPLARDLQHNTGISQRNELENIIIDPINLEFEIT